MTPEAIVALVSRVSTQVVDRMTGGRADYPLLLSLAVQEGLKSLDIISRVMYGSAAWIELLEEGEIPVWAVCKEPHPHFWVETQFSESVDLSLSVAHLSRSKSDLGMKTLVSPPMLWSVEIPKFIRLVPEGIAEMHPDDERDQKLLRQVSEEMKEKCTVKNLEPIQWPVDAFLCNGKKLLDDPAQSFQKLDRSLSVYGLPPSPI